MFTRLAIKKYVSKLRPTLEKRYGIQTHYTSSQVRATVFQKDFSPRFLPLGYIMCLDTDELQQALKTEFPDIDIIEYKAEVMTYLNDSSIYLDLVAMEPH